MTPFEVAMDDPLLDRRGVRNNNPGNLRGAYFGAVGSDGSFAQYATPADGISALTKQLVRYYEGKTTGSPLRTVRDIIKTYAPDSENNTDAYVKAVSQSLGVDPDTELDLKNPDVMTKFADAIIKHENGGNPYSMQYLRGAVSGAVPGFSTPPSEEKTKMAENSGGGFSNIFAGPGLGLFNALYGRFLPGGSPVPPVGTPPVAPSGVSVNLNDPPPGVLPGVMERNPDIPAGNDDPNTPVTPFVTPGFNPMAPVPSPPPPSPEPQEPVTAQRRDAVSFAVPKKDDPKFFGTPWGTDLLLRMGAGALGGKSLQESLAGAAGGAVAANTNETNRKAQLAKMAGSRFEQIAKLIQAGVPAQEAALAVYSGNPGYISTSMKSNLSEGQKALDKEYAKSYAEWVQNGQPDTEKNLVQLKSARMILEKNKDLTGFWTGVADKAGVLQFTNKEAQQLKEQVAEVTQRNLRAVLGGQFAMKEGEQLIDRAFNPALSADQNITRLQRLEASIQKAYEAKKAAADYFNQHGTLKGYSGPKPMTFADLEREAGLDSKSVQAISGTTQTNVKFKVITP